MMTCSYKKNLNRLYIIYILLVRIKERILLNDIIGIGDVFKDLDQGFLQDSLYFIYSDSFCR